MKPKKHILVLGAGFGGLTFCQRFSQPDAEVTLIDRQNHHLFQPLIYQVATAGLSVPEVAQPIRQILSRKQNTTVLLDQVIGIDLKEKSVFLRENKTPLSYDYLVLSFGAVTNYFGHDEWEKYAPGLKTIDDATRIRHDVLLAFEEAESSDNEERRKALMTIAVIGGGATGVELAGALIELARNVLRKDFNRIDPSKARVILIEGSDRLLLNFPEALSQSARKQIEAMGVEVRTNTIVKDIQKGTVLLENEVIHAENIIWTAGVKANPLTQMLGVPCGPGGRIKVNPDLSLPGYPDVFAVGDIVTLNDAKGKLVPGVAPAAMQMAQFVVKTIQDKINDPSQKTKTAPAFVYKDKGAMATIGRSAAVAAIGKIKFSGFFAWIAWLSIHLLFLIGFRNKLVVVIQWFYSYVNYKRGARIITGLDKDYSTADNDKKTG